MEPAALAEAARGESVTADRLTDPVVERLADREQPHHLLRANSVDLPGDENRVFPAVDAEAWAVATDRRVLFVVPGAVGTTVAGVDYGVVLAADARTRVPKDLGLETIDGDYRAYVADDEDPEPFVRFVGRARRDPASVRGE